MKKQLDPLTEILDSSILIKTVFVRENGKLRIVHRKAKIGGDRVVTQKPMFPISKVRQ
jgi:hypothetical protein